MSRFVAEDVFPCMAKRGVTRTDRLIQGRVVTFWQEAVLFVSDGEIFLLFGRLGGEIRRHFISSSSRFKLRIAAGLHLNDGVVILKVPKIAAVRLKSSLLAKREKSVFG